MYILLGLGLQGKAILKYLLDHTDEQILSFDPQLDIEVYTEMKNEKWTHYNDNDSAVWKHNIEKVTLISSLPTYKNPDIAYACASRGWNYLDLGGDVVDTLKIKKHHHSAEISGSSLVPDCGVAPGLACVYAGYLYKHNSYTNIKIFCGGLPKEPIFPLGYIKTFAPIGLLKEYTGVVEQRKYNKLNKIPALSEKEKVCVDNILFEAQPTSGSLSLTPRELSVETLTYKTLRYKGHWKYIKDNILIQPDPLRILEEILEPVWKGNPDVLYLHFQVNNKSYRTWKWTYDFENNISAMAQATGYTASCIAVMAHEGLLNKGFVNLHDIDFIKLEELLKKVPNQLREI